MQSQQPARWKRILVYAVYWMPPAILGSAVIMAVLSQITLDTTPPPATDARAVDAWCGRRVLSAHDRLSRDPRAGEARLLPAEVTALEDRCSQRSPHLAAALKALGSAVESHGAGAAARVELAAERRELLAMISRFARGD